MYEQETVKVDSYKDELMRERYFLQNTAEDFKDLSEKVDLSFTDTALDYRALNSLKYVL